MKLGKGYIVVIHKVEKRQFRDTNNAQAWLRAIDRSGTHLGVQVLYPDSLGAGWFSGTARGGVESINSRLEACREK